MSAGAHRRRRDFLSLRSRNPDARVLWPWRRDARSTFVETAIPAARLRSMRSRLARSRRCARPAQRDHRSDRVQSDTRVGCTIRRSARRARLHDRALRYDPQPLGLAVAREAVAGGLRPARRAGRSRSTSCCRRAPARPTAGCSSCSAIPARRVLVPQPSYPLFEHLTRLEGVQRDSVPPARTTAGGRSTSTRCRAPPRDTCGRCCWCRRTTRLDRLSRAHEARRLVEICRERGWALIADEVFADYPLDEHRGSDRDAS